ncbi:hypothetical protein G6F64_015016 [Rhizopus arrhizus]|uniref:Uncharacterized protein n=1 Tax=Rhizopus oryzae TaxID=64495 RepID=A0A9P7BIY1_RHIOR|nr:hypothetical protein G6F64_015016 [Rhizopus arrhizus]
MQRDGECHRTVLRQAVHHGDDARGGHRDAAARQAIGVVVQPQAQRRQDLVVVEQGFAHAHHDHVADDARIFGGLGAFQAGGADVGFQHALGPPQLNDDFAGFQVAVEALMPACRDRLRG